MYRSTSGTQGFRRTPTAVLGTKQDRRVRDSSIKMIPLEPPGSLASAPPSITKTAPAPSRAQPYTRPGPAERQVKSLERTSGRRIAQEFALTKQIPIDGIQEARNAADALRPQGSRVSDSNVAAVRRSATSAQVQAADTISTAASIMSSGREGSLVIDADFAESGRRQLRTDADFRWARDNYSNTRRTVDIWAAVASLRLRTWLLDAKWSYVGGFTAAAQAQRQRKTAAWLRETALDLGPTFIKVGQLFSTRSDLLPAEFTEELAQLQDRVPAFSADKVREILTVQLGAPPSVLFAAFDERPLAAASLGQVHRATLHDGTQVVVKVQRPGLKELFDIDLKQLGRVAALLDAQDEGRRDLKGIHAECCTILYQEIDYINEGRNADRFRRNFQGLDWVEAPSVYWRLTSPKVITLSYLPGIKISDVQSLTAAGLDTSAVAVRATEAYLLQVLRHGFLHADPHPGNIAVGTKGQLLFYDFGMMSSTSGTKDKLLDVFYGVAKQDVDQVVTALVALNIIVPTADLTSIRRSLQFFLKEFQAATQREETIGAIGEDLFAIAVDQPFRFPATFTFVLRAFSTLEGLGKALDPKYNFSDVAKPYALELLQLEDAKQAQGFVLSRLQQQAMQIGADAGAVPTRVAKMDSTLAQLESGELKIRTRVLESERADRRQAVLQMTTVMSVASVGLANIATQFGIAGQGSAAWSTGLLAAGFAASVAIGFRRVKKLDKFEKDIKM